MVEALESGIKPGMCAFVRAIFKELPNHHRQILIPAGPCGSCDNIRAHLTQLTVFVIRLSIIDGISIQVRFPFMTASHLIRDSKPNNFCKAFVTALLISTTTLVFS